MVLYVVKWLHDNKLAKGKGRPSINEDYLVVTVLCDHRSSALRAFEYWFDHEFDRLNKHGFVIDDGQIQMSRTTIDSRGFTAHYLMTSEMREPIYLSNISSNSLRAHKIFGR